jgi:hypothetical protein
LGKGERGRVKGRRSGAQALGIFLQQFKRRSRSMVAEVNGSCNVQFHVTWRKCAMGVRGILVFLNGLLEWRIQYD